MALELNGTTGVSLVQDGVVTAADLASTLDLTGKTVTLPSGTGGKVLQVVSAVDTTSATINTTTATEVHSASITPSSSSSKILILCGYSSYVGGGSSVERWDIKLWRGSVGGTELVKTEFFRESSGQMKANPNQFVYLDSPATTSSVTYKISVGKRSGSDSFEWVIDSAEYAVITLLEIAG